MVRAVRADDPTATPVELLDGAGRVISFEDLDNGELVVLTLNSIEAIRPG